MTIKVLKLMNGDDIIADIENDDRYNDILLLHDPLRLTNQYDAAQKKFKVQLMPWTPYTSDRIIPIDVNFIVATYNPNKLCMDGYIDATEYKNENERLLSDGRHVPITTAPEPEPTSSSNPEKTAEDLYNLLTLVNADEDTEH